QRLREEGPRPMSCRALVEPQTSKLGDFPALCRRCRVTGAPLGNGILPAPPGYATMKTVRSLPLVALLALASGNALGGSPTDVTRYDCKLPESDRPAGGARTVVTASPELVKAVVLDFEHYAHYFDPDKGRNPNRKWASHVVGKSGDKTDVYLEVPILKGAAKIWAIIRFAPPQKVGDTEVVVGHMLKG